MIRSLILFGSGALVGVALWVGTVEGLNVFRQRDWLAGAYSAVAFGTTILVLLVGELVVKAPFIPGSWRAWAYILGLFLAGSGWIGIGVDLRRRRHRRLH